MKETTRDFHSEQENARDIKQKESLEGREMDLSGP